MRRLPLVTVLVLSSLVLGGQGCSCGEDPIQRISGTIDLATGVVNFGRVCVGDTGIYDLEVTNAGNVALHISSVEVAGSAVFSVESFPDTLAPVSDPEGSKGTIRILFTPSAEGDAFADLVVKSDDLDRPEVSARLSGSGDGGERVALRFLCESETGSDLAPCPSVISFGDVGVDLTKEIPLVLENTGCALVTVEDVRLEDFVGNGGFALTAPDTPFNVTNVVQQTIVPALTPKKADAFGANLVLDYQDAGLSKAGQESLSLVGNGVELQLFVDPPSYNFAQADISTPETKTFTISNAGGLAGEIVSLTLEKGDPEFEITKAPSLPASIDAYGQVTFDVTYTPTDSEPDEDAVSIITGFGALPPVAISGGPTPSIEVTPSVTVDFGTVATGGHASQTVTIANAGGADLVVSSLSFTVNPANVFSFDSLPPMPQTLAPGASFDVVVNFDDDPGIGKNADGSGQSEVGELTIVSDDPNYAAQGGGYVLTLQTDTQANYGPSASIDTFVAGSQCFSQPCPLEVCNGEVAAFNGANSSDPENDPLTYLWEITSAPSGATATLTQTGGVSTQLTPDFPGRWTIRLTVTDPFGNQATEVSELSVSKSGC